MQQLNPVEANAIRWLKKDTLILLDTLGAQPELWLYNMQCVQNTISKETLRWNVPLMCKQGETQDIFAWLLFKVFDPVYYSQNV